MQNEQALSGVLPLAAARVTTKSARLMRSLRFEHLFAALGATLLIESCGANAMEPPHETGGKEDPTLEDFFIELHKGQHATFALVNELPQLADTSELVVLAEMTEFVEGGTVLGGPSIVAKLTVEETIRGPDKDHLYVELLHAPVVRAEDLQEVFVPFRGLWFLGNALAISSPLDADRGRGVPEGEPLLRPVSSQGLLIADSVAGLVQPLDTEHMAWLPELDLYATLDEVAAAIPRQ